jgi:hypothetical protein
MIQRLTILITEIITTYKFLFFSLSFLAAFSLLTQSMDLKNKLNELLDQNKNCHGCDIGHVVYLCFTIQSFVF